MTAISAKTLDGGDLKISRDTADALQASLRGDLLFPGDGGYETSRRIWNGMIDRSPAMVARCLGTADVVTCVNFAREQGVALTIRSGGHNIAGLAVTDGALTIDLTRMRGVAVDTGRRVAHAQAGCTLGDVDHETQLHGLAAVLGFVSNTGIAGLTLGGGFGYLTRRFGWTSDTVRSMKVVTADGRVRHVSGESEPELFWGLRGGGGNFGVVTNFEYELYDVGPEIYGGAIAWPAEEAPKVLQMFREFNDGAPPDLVAVAVLRIAPPAPWLPKEIHGRPIVALFVCDTGPIAEAEKRVAPIKNFGTPAGDVIQRRSYVSQQSLLDATQPFGRRYYWKSEYVPDVQPGLLEKLVTNLESITSPHAALLLFPLRGALNGLPENHSAVGNRKTAAVFNIAGSWEEAKDDDVNIEWARTAWRDMRSYSTGGTYINFLTEEEGESRIQEAYGENLERLIDIKTKYDPENLFRMNKNITPR